MYKVLIFFGVYTMTKDLKLSEREYIDVEGGVNTEKWINKSTKRDQSCDKLKNFLKI